MTNTQNNNIQLFNFNKINLRTTGTFSDPMFCLNDVCNCLELPNSSVYKQRITERFGEEVTRSYPLQTKGGIQNVTFVNEKAFYYLVMRSDKKEAVAFQDWVFSEVLPTIRKTGSFGTPALPNNLKISVQQASEIKELVYKIADSFAYPNGKNIKTMADSRYYDVVQVSKFLLKVLKNKFGLRRYGDLLLNDFDNAISYVKNYTIPKSMRSPQLDKQQDIVNYLETQPSITINGNNQAITSIEKTATELVLRISLN